jgi:hypothetical protein
MDGWLLRCKQFRVFLVKGVAKYALCCQQHYRRACSETALVKGPLRRVPPDQEGTAIRRFELVTYFGLLRRQPSHALWLLSDTPGRRDTRQQKDNGTIHQIRYKEVAVIFCLKAKSPSPSLHWDVQANFVFSYSLLKRVPELLELPRERGTFVFLFGSHWHTHTIR